MADATGGSDLFLEPLCAALSLVVVGFTLAGPSDPSQHGPVVGNPRSSSTNSGPFKIGITVANENP
jgi:hypothetical protein